MARDKVRKDREGVKMDTIQDFMESIEEDCVEGEWEKNEYAKELAHYERIRGE